VGSLQTPNSFEIRLQIREDPHYFWSFIADIQKSLYHLGRIGHWMKTERRSIPVSNAHMTFKTLTLNITSH
jgi:hypothetical protein